MLGKGKKKLDFNNYKGLKPTKINHKEAEEEEFYGYGYTGKYLNNGEAIDFANNHGQLPNFRTHKPVQLQPSDLGYQHYRGSKYQRANYGPQSQDEWNYGTTDPNFKYGGHTFETLVLKQADSFFGDLKPPSPPPQNVQPSQPRRGKIPFLFGF